MMRKLARLVGAIGVVHAGEDILLMSLGRWLPVPVWLLFLVGVVLSAFVLTFLIRRFTLAVQWHPSPPHPSIGGPSVRFLRMAHQCLTICIQYAFQRGVSDLKFFRGLPPRYLLIVELFFDGAPFVCKSRPCPHTRSSDVRSIGFC